MTTLQPINASSDALQRPSMATVERVIGRFEGSKPGPVVLVAGGLHGNEWTGIVAVQRVLERLDQRGPGPFRGTFVGIAGNVRAIRRRVRYIDRDLNRTWKTKTVAKLRSGDVPRDAPAEYHEMVELMELISKIREATEQQPYFLDLHTSSAPSVPFGVLSDNLRNRRFAQHLRVPTLLGLEEYLHGTLADHLAEEGWTTLGFEGGQHDDPVAIDTNEAAIWTTLLAAGCIRRDAYPDALGKMRYLATQGAGYPPLVEIRFRHPITEESGFYMQPGYANFAPVERGELLAHDNDGPIHSPADGLLVMPLYQGQGEDGFFVGRAVNREWLLISTLLRRLHLDPFLRLLPGVRRYNNRQGWVAIDPKLARWGRRGLMHLLGYRWRGNQAGRAIYSRRNDK